MKTKLKQRWDGGRMLRRMNSGIFLSLSAGFMLCLFAPLEIYLSNPGEFWYDAYFLFPVCIKFFCAVLLLGLVGFSALYLLGDRFYNLALACGFWGFIGCYVQGNFGVKGLPPFDGTEVNWAAYRTETIGSTVCWLLIAVLIGMLLFFLKTAKFRQLVSAVSLFLFAILFSTLAVIGINGGLFDQKQYVKFTKTNQFEMSTEQNFIILLLDAIDEECFRQVWEQHPEYESAMADFTYYDNAMTGYAYTAHALPLMLSGEWYENTEPFEDYSMRVYRDAPIFNRLESEGYSLSFYDDELQFEVGTMDGEFDNMTYIKSTLYAPNLFALRQLKMVGVKYAPYLLKPFCWFDPAKLGHQELAASSKSLFNWKNKEFYDDINSGEITLTDQKRFKLLHLMGAHVPFYYDQYLNETEDADYFSCIESSMTTTIAYLEKLKEAGVYDNSIILICSDHGYNISGDAVKIPQRNENANGRQHPILFIKGLDEHHDLQISGAPISYEDLAAAYNRLLDGAASDAVFDYQEGDYRERRYLLYHYMDENHMVEYLQTGDAGDESTLLPTGRVFDRK